MKKITTSLQQCKKNNVSQWVLAGILTFFLLTVTAFILIRNNCKARIDFIISEGNDVGLSTTFDADVYYPEWIKNDNGQGMIIEFPVKRKWENKIIIVRVVNNGKVDVCFRNSDARIGWEKVPFVVNYRNLQINGENITVASDENGIFCHNLTIEDKNAVSISVEVNKKLSINLKILQALMRDNAGILLSLIIVSLFVFRKLIYYCSHFCRTKCSWLDVLFLFIFFVILYLLISNTFDDNTF